MKLVLKYHVEADIHINYMILACDLHYSIKLISKKLLLCSMIKDSLTIITHSTTKMFVFKSLTNHNKEVILNTQHKTCQTFPAICSAPSRIRRASLFLLGTLVGELRSDIHEVRQISSNMILEDFATLSADGEACRNQRRIDVVKRVRHKLTDVDVVKLQRDPFSITLNFELKVM